MQPDVGPPAKNFLANGTLETLAGMHFHMFLQVVFLAIRFSASFTNPAFLRLLVNVLHVVVVGRFSYKSRSADVTGIFSLSDVNVVYVKAEDS